MQAILKVFDVLVGHNLQPIVLRPKSKIPVQKAWNEQWNEKSNRDLFKHIENANVGLLLGKVIDVEGDTLAANQTVSRLIGDYPHPSYRSRKSVHHLFLTPDPELRIVKYKGIEFRGQGHQSVLPPSVMEDGLSYEWINFTFPIPEMPQALLSFFDNVRKKKQKGRVVIKPDHMYVSCAACRKKDFIHKKRFELELIAFQVDVNSGWHCHNCRKLDLRQRCREIRKIIRKNPEMSEWRNWK